MRFSPTFSFWKILFGIFLGIWILILTLIAFNHTFSCVNKKGELRIWCEDKRNKLKDGYKNQLSSL